MIGVFDSGMGGLTVLAALRAALPERDFLYLGDTARLPYGTKSPQTVVRYALQAAELLIERGAETLVVACNTASAVALPALRARFDGLTVCGVVEPGAAAACAATRTGHIGVLATEGTVRGGAYPREIQRLRPDMRVSQLACSLLVALAEEGWTSGAEPEAVTRRYLEPWFAELGTPPDVLVLGCTHFPLLADTICTVAGPAVQVVDSAATTAAALRERLHARGAAHAGRSAGRIRYLATDDIERFARVGGRFLRAPLAAEDVELVEL
ncbi:MAG: glutamate racemase [Steroidobacteraceae bacterium]|nr:glutamate racemase [Steroidobacteraceae bacterium]MDW8260459.1 glutamate racemase [Gammaproteobacteria bacterium]